MVVDLHLHWCVINQSSTALGRDIGNICYFMIVYPGVTSVGWKIVKWKTGSTIPQRS